MKPLYHIIYLDASLIRVTKVIGPRGECVKRARETVLRIYLSLSHKRVLPSAFIQEAFWFYFLLL